MAVEVWVTDGGLQMQLGWDRFVTVSSGELSWKRGPLRTEKRLALSELAAVELKKRPFFEMLALALGSIGCLALASGTKARIFFLFLGAMDFFACFVLRKYSLVVKRKNGQSHRFALGINLPVGRWALGLTRGWSRFSGELRRRGFNAVTCAWPFIAAVVWLGGGCGYRFAAKGAGLPGNVRSVCAPIFMNRTAEPALELELTEAVRRRLLRAGRLGGAGCEARFEGEILAISGAPTVLTPSGTLASYRLQGTVRARLVKGATVISEAQVSEFEDYLPGGRLGDILRTESNRQSALHRLAIALADELYRRMASSW